MKIPKFFSKEYVIPWSKRVTEAEIYNESMSQDLIAQLKSEIKRLDLSKVEAKKNKGSTLHKDEADAKCVSKSCKYAGLNPNYKSVWTFCLC